MQYGPKPLIDEWAWKPWKPVSSLWGLIVMTVLMGAWLAHAASYHGCDWRYWLDEKVAVLAILGAIIRHLYTRERDAGLDVPDTSMRMLFQVAMLLIVVLGMLIGQSYSSWDLC